MGIILCGPNSCGKSPLPENILRITSFLQVHSII